MQLTKFGQPSLCEMPMAGEQGQVQFGPIHFGAELLSSLPSPPVRSSLGPFVGPSMLTTVIGTINFLELAENIDHVKSHVDRIRFDMFFYKVMLIGFSLICFFIALSFR